MISGTAFVVEEVALALAEQPTREQFQAIADSGFEKMGVVSNSVL